MKIFLIGFMGAGKTTLGKKIANELNLPFFDLDDLIEKKEGKLISVIFDKLGEEHFRKLEYKTLLSIKEPGIYSTGGGIVENPDCINWFKNYADSVVWLNPSWDTLYERIHNSDRPLVKNNSKDSLKTLLKKRNPLYDEIANLVFDGSDLDEIVEALHSSMKK